MNQNEFSILIGLAVAHLFAVASPGPDFMAVVKQSLQFGRKSAILVSAGIACGLIIHCLFALTILSTFIHWIPHFLPLMKILSALYLLYLAYQCVRSKKKSDSLNGESNMASPFLIGLMTNGTNPKVFVYISAIFTTIAGKFQTIILVGVSLYLALQTFVWFILVSLLFCQNKTRELYYAHQKKIDITMAVILICFAGFLLFSTIDYS